MDENKWNEMKNEMKFIVFGLMSWIVFHTCKHKRPLFLYSESFVDICHWMGEFYYSSNSERGWNMVSLCNYSHCNAMARLDTQWYWVSPYLWQQKHYIWYGTYGHTVTLSYPAVMCFAVQELLKVRKRVWRGNSFPCFPS